MKKSNSKENIIKAPDLSILGKAHENKWVALTPDYKRVISTGDSLAEVVDKTSQDKEKIVFKALAPLGYAPTSVKI